MTISTTTRKAGPFTGNGTTASFPFAFKVFTAADVYVVRTSASLGTDTVLALTTNYTVSLNANQDTSPGGTVTLTSGNLATGFSLTITSNVDAKQPTDLTNQGGFFPKVVTNALDRLTILVQQLIEQVGRSLKVSVSTPAGVRTTLPAPSANKLIGWNEAGDNLQNVDPITMASIVAFATGRVDLFAGNGTATQFALSANPGALTNLDVSVGGVDQRPGVDFTWSGGTVLTFTSAPPAAPLGTADPRNVCVKYKQALPQSYADGQTTYWVDNVGVSRDVQSTLQRITGDWVSVKDPRFGARGNGVADDTAAIQAAINWCWNNSRTLYIPAGTYLVTGLTLAGSVGQQNTILKIMGDGFGNPFAVWSVSSGTVIKSTTDAPVFRITVPSVTTSAGTLDIQGVVFDGTSTTPVVYLQAFYGAGKIDRCCVLQRGSGNGIQVDWMTTSEISHTYILNKDWMNSGLGASRTGIGLYLSHQYDSGLQTIRKVSSRGFLTAYKIGQGGGSAYTYNASIENCECSVTYNGIHLTDNARSTTVTNCYLEGGEGGTGIWDQGDYNKVVGCFTFAGYATHLKSTDFTYGNYYEGNTFTAGTEPNQVMIDLISSAASGGPGKTCSGNHLSFGGSGGSIAGVIGMRINGTDPRLNLLGNTFYPRGGWVGGAGTTKLSDLSSGGVIGMTTAISGSGAQEIPMLSRGAVSLEMADSGLSQFNVSGNVLSVPGGSLFYCNASSAVTVNRLLTDGTPGRILIFNTQNANMTFQNSAYMFLNGGTSFASRGHIVFYTQVTGGSVYAYELCRSTY